MICKATRDGLPAQSFGDNLSRLGPIEAIKGKETCDDP